MPDLCECCDPTPAWISPAVVAWGRGRTGLPNASQVTEVLPRVSTLVDLLLDGAPVAGSDYEGRYQQITATIAVPISTWDEDNNRWERSSTGYETITLTHPGDPVVESFVDIDSDTVIDPLPELNEGEGFQFGWDEDPNSGFIIPHLVDLDLSSVETSGPVGKTEMLAFVDDLPADYVPYGEAAGSATGISFYGNGAAGVILDDYESDWPFVAERMDVRWGARARIDTFPVPDYGVPMWSGPQDLRAATEITYIDETADPVDPETSPLMTHDLPWSIDQWSSYVDGADPQASGWFPLAPTTLGTVRVVSTTSWQLDAAPKFEHPR